MKESVGVVTYYMRIHGMDPVGMNEVFAIPIRADQCSIAPFSDFGLLRKHLHQEVDNLVDAANHEFGGKKDELKNPTPK